MSVQAAIASECAADQALFWPFHDQLFVHRDQFSRAVFLQIAGELGLDLTRFTTCLDARVHEGRALADVEAGRAMDVFGTPTIFVNGRGVPAFPADALRAAVLEAAR